MIYAIALLALGFFALFATIWMISPTALRRLPAQDQTRIETGRGGYVTLNTAQPHHLARRSNDHQ